SGTKRSPLPRQTLLRSRGPVPILAGSPCPRPLRRSVQGTAGARAKERSRTGSHASAALPLGHGHIFSAHVHGNQAAIAGGSDIEDTGRERRIGSGAFDAVLRPATGNIVILERTAPDGIAAQHSERIPGAYIIGRDAAAHGT